MDNELSYDMQHIRSELKKAQEDIDMAYLSFDEATQPELIDCCIYMINAASLRYKFLLQRARKLNINETNAKIENII